MVEPGVTVGEGEEADEAGDEEGGKGSGAEADETGNDEVDGGTVVAVGVVRPGF